MTEKSDLQNIGEYDPPLPKRYDIFSKENVEVMEKILQRHPEIEEKYNIKLAKEIHQKTLVKYGIKTFNVKYISDKPSIFFNKDEVYVAFMPRDNSRFYGFFLEDMDEPGTYALPIDRFERVDEDSRRYFAMRKIVEAEIMSEKGALRITLTDPEILDDKEWPVIEGYSWGIEPDFDEEGEERDNDVLVIDAYYPKAYFRLRDEDIAKVEVASQFQKLMEGN